MTDKQKEFLGKLKSLLEEYSMSINSYIEGDTHGIDNEYMTIEEQNGREYTPFYKLERAFSISHHDIIL